MNRFQEKVNSILNPHGHTEVKKSIWRKIFLFIIIICLIVFLLIYIGKRFYIYSKDMWSAVLPALLVDLTNEARMSEDVGNLVRNPTLDEVARMKAQDMVEKGYFAHTSPQGVTPWYWFKRAGYNFSYAGENLAVNFTESSDVEEAWLASPSHKANILNKRFTEIGIATAEGEYKGKPATYVVQVFARPLSSDFPFWRR